MKKVMGLFLGLIGVLVIACVLVVAWPSFDQLIQSSPLSSLSKAADDAKNSVANTAVNASGIKARVQNALDSNVDRIAEATGIPAETVRDAVNAVDVESWEVVSLPDDAQAVNSLSGSAMGVEGTVTLYDDPSIVTVNAYGQEITFEIPEGAQGYMGFAALLG